MLEFNNEHAKANFSKLKNMVLEFNNNHTKANFSKLKNMVLEFNNNHTKANLKDLDLKLKKALLVVSGVGLITVATGCSINQNYNLDQTTVENVIENELFNDNQEIVVGAEKVDVYEQSEVVMDALESVGVLLEEPEQVEELSYEEFKETVENAANIINEREIDVWNDTRGQMQDKKTNPISYTDQELTEFEKELMGDYYAIREYVEQNQSQDYQELYNNVLITRMHELLASEGINNIEITDIVNNNSQTLLTLNVDGEEMSFEVAQNSNLASMIDNMEQKDYDNFKEEINTLINKDMYLVKVNGDDRITQGEENVNIVGGVVVVIGIIGATLTIANEVVANKRNKTM